MSSQRLASDAHDSLSRAPNFRPTPVADEVGSARQSILLLEHGCHVLSLALVFRIARALGKSIEEVFEFVE